MNLLGSLSYKFLWLLLTLWLIITLTFVLMKVIPGDPLDNDGKLPKETLRQLRAYYQLDRPIFEQYTHYLSEIVRGNFGPSMIYSHLSVLQILRDNFPSSCLLGIQAIIFTLICGIGAALLSLIFSGGWFDKCLFGISTLSLAIPSYLMAAWLQYLFALKLGWFPVARWGTFSHTVLPTLSLAALPAAFVYRITRNTLLDVLKQDYIKTARAKGLSWPHIYFFHALKNSLFPAISYLGQITASVLTGSFIIEKIYSIPGLGQWLVLSIHNRDYPVIMGITIFYSAILLLSVAFADLLYMFFDPRIRLKGRQ